MTTQKYRPAPVIHFPQRTWPSKQITQAPLWCSVDLRDGNQALQTPLTLEQKLDFFQYLVKIGFKEIEIGFPASSDLESDFVRTLIEQNLIPDDVTIQVLTQSRDEIIRKTFESLRGVKNATVHLYNATSPLFRDVVFGKSKEETIALATFGAKLIKQLADEYSAKGGENFSFEYSPECFSQTEPDFAIEVCNAVISCWEGHKTIINLPFTVETHTPNVHADMIEYVCGKLINRDKILVSLHAHNDRGTAVAATELCLLAGADRVEGTLFGNGERTGNADLLTLAMNMYSHGIDTGLDFSNIDEAIRLYEAWTHLPVHPRHPFAGELVYTAFSGSHQDAIRKGIARRKDGDFWEMPYLPIDPVDVGRSYDPLIRFTSQSGSSSVAYLLETYFVITLPKALQRDFGPLVTSLASERSSVLTPQEILDLFDATYVNLASPNKFIKRANYSQEGEVYTISCDMLINGKETVISGRGGGPIEALCLALSDALKLDFKLVHYNQDTLDEAAGAGAQAISYIGINDGNKTHFGAGVSKSITNSALKAVVSAVNRMMLAAQ